MNLCKGASDATSVTKPRFLSKYFKYQEVVFLLIHSEVPLNKKSFLTLFVTFLYNLDGAGKKELTPSSTRNLIAVELLLTNEPL